MNPEMFAGLVATMDKFLDKYCEKDIWTGLVHPGLTKQMAKAAMLVFDASMDGQEYARTVE